MASPRVEAAAPPVQIQDLNDEEEFSDEDDDPVTAEYDIFITPQLASAASLYLLQFPTREREQTYNAANSNAPVELRMKSNSGFLEMDVAINQDFHYDKGKAQTWGSALSKTKAEGQQSYGMAGGFAHSTGLRGPAARGAGTGRGRGSQQQLDEDDDPGHMMKVQTLGGQIVKDERGRPNYMIGAFRGAELHLTPVSGIIQMRPQFHHIDAKTIVEKNTARKSREASGEAAAARPAEPRAVQMFNKAASSTEAENLEGQTESTKEHLTKAMEEGWTRLNWVDEEEQSAYDAWHDSMFLEDTDKAPKLVTSMEDEAYLDQISAPRLDPSGKHILRPMHRKGKGMTIATGIEIYEDGDDDEVVPEEAVGGEDAEARGNSDTEMVV